MLGVERGSSRFTVSRPLELRADAVQLISSRPVPVAGPNPAEGPAHLAGGR